MDGEVCGSPAVTMARSPVSTAPFFLATLSAS
jgi:hypothetical protein